MQPKIYIYNVKLHCLSSSFKLKLCCYLKELNMKTGDKIAKLRKQNNLTQDQLASLLKVSRQSVSKWESNITYPETDKIIRISQIFDCSIDYLLNDKIEEPQAKEIKSEINSVQEQVISQNVTSQESEVKKERCFVLTINRLLLMIIVLLSFIAFFLQFAPFVVGSISQHGIGTIYVQYNCIESISMIADQTMVCPFFIIITSLANFILPIVSSFVTKASKKINIALLVTSSTTFIFTFFLYIEAMCRLSGSNNSVNTFQGGTFFFDLFVLVIIGLSIAVIYLESHNKNKVLHVFKK